MHRKKKKNKFSIRVYVIFNYISPFDKAHNGVLRNKSALGNNNSYFNYIKFQCALIVIIFLLAVIVSIQDHHRVSWGYNAFPTVTLYYFKSGNCFKGDRTRVKQLSLDKLPLRLLPRSGTPAKKKGLKSGIRKKPNLICITCITN